MRVAIKTPGFDQTDRLPDHAQERFEFAHQWTSQGVSSISNNLSDINGPRGGKAKRCQIHISLPGNRAVLIQDSEPDLYAAISLAADRANQTLGRRGTASDHGRSLGRPPAHVDAIAV